MLMHGAQPTSPSRSHSHASIHHQQQQPPAQGLMDNGYTSPTRTKRKRKAESQDNERLSKRLSLLNLEQSGHKLYVPVETPTASSSTDTLSQRNPPSSSAIPNDSMQVDDSKHKVYIYNLDDELSSEESDGEEAKLVFLPDIEKHLFANRIPPGILPNKDGELAGMQMVLYNVPTSLTVPEDKDNVRKAIIESRARHRERQRQENEPQSTSSSLAANPTPALTNPFEATLDDYSGGEMELD